MKKLFLIILISFGLFSGIIGLNYLYVGKYVDDIINEDSRNTGIDISVHLENYINPSVIIFDIRKVSYENSSTDVFRVFLDYSSRMQDKTFKTVNLAYRGKVKFYINGYYFKELGRNFGSENPVYTLRTFPENLYRPNGLKAFETWEGGIIGVFSQQMDDFNSFHKEWYISDLNNN